MVEYISDLDKTGVRFPHYPPNKMNGNAKEMWKKRNDCLWVV